MLAVLVLILHDFKMLPLLFFNYESDNTCSITHA